MHHLPFKYNELEENVEYLKRQYRSDSFLPLHKNTYKILCNTRCGYFTTSGESNVLHNIGINNEEDDIKKLQNNKQHVLTSNYIFTCMVNSLLTEHNQVKPPKLLVDDTRKFYNVYKNIDPMNGYDIKWKNNDELSYVGYINILNFYGDGLYQRFRYMDNDLKNTIPQLAQLPIPTLYMLQSILAMHPNKHFGEIVYPYDISAEGDTYSGKLQHKMKLAEGKELITNYARQFNYNIGDAILLIFMKDVIAFWKSLRGDQSGFDGKIVQEIIGEKKLVFNSSKMEYLYNKYMGIEGNEKERDSTLVNFVTEVWKNQQYFVADNFDENIFLLMPAIRALNRLFMYVTQVDSLVVRIKGDGKVIGDIFHELLLALYRLLIDKSDAQIDFLHYDVNTYWKIFTGEIYEVREREDFKPTLEKYKSGEEREKLTILLNSYRRNPPPFLKFEWGFMGSQFFYIERGFYKRKANESNVPPINIAKRLVFYGLTSNEKWNVMDEFRDNEDEKEFARLFNTTFNNVYMREWLYCIAIIRLLEDCVKSEYVALALNMSIKHPINLAIEYLETIVK